MLAAPGIGAPRRTQPSLRQHCPMTHFPAVNASAPSANVLQQKTILIVEDNQTNARLFQDLLQAHGYRTIHTADGRDVLDLAQQHRPDLIVMDIQLPEVSGVEATKRLKENADLRYIPVVAVTAFAMKGDEERFRAAGCDGYVTKPIAIAPFLRTISSFLN